MSVIAGLIGILLPLVPTTPFLLLAAWCFARSSPRFYRLLLGNRWLGPYIRNYREGRGLTMAAKVSTLVVLWLAIASTVWFIAPMPWARVVLLTIATGVTIYLLRLPTTTAEASQTRAEAGAPAETGWD
ncbi:MAG: hypothetical protein CME13_09965 [Gemmatimonadetes bacterium]|nr:hypothetical protein [Gemmatimonadota bacterium]HCV23524.1 DUF454 domain-containing protein [Candidatus Latescibacterota bacterium]